MTSLHVAEFQQPLPGGAVLCALCPHECRIRSGARGACGVRFNEGGKLYTLVHERVCARHVDPVEKKPLFHFLPGSRVYSIATVGCNLSCTFCQNWDTSQWPKQALPKSVPTGGLASLQEGVPGGRVTPREVVDAAIASGCASVAYTYTEPTVFFELAFETAQAARERGLRNVFVTNGFTAEAPLRKLATVLDAVNVDLKSMRPEAYRTVTRSRLAPVLDAIRWYRKLGVWVEVTTPVIPGFNDSDAELRDLARFLCSVGSEVPWHVSRFHPAYRMRDRPATPLKTLRRAAEIGRDAGLRYVYTGNVPGAADENTYCSSCAALLIERCGFGVRTNRVDAARCPDCGTRIGGFGMSGTPARPRPSC